MAKGGTWPSALFEAQLEGLYPQRPSGLSSRVIKFKDLSPLYHNIFFTGKPIPWGQQTGEGEDHPLRLGGGRGVTTAICGEIRGLHQGISSEADPLETKGGVLGLDQSLGSM